MGKHAAHRPSILSTFLGKITRRLSVDKWREKTAQKRGGGELPLVFDELGECIASQNDTHDKITANGLSEIIDEFISSMPDVERRVFVCRYWYVDSVADISKQFGFSQSKVKSMLHRTRSKLRIHLQEEGILDEN